MSVRSRLAFVGEVFAIMSDAVAVSAAVENRRMPNQKNLAGLGIDPQQFQKIRRF